MPTPLLKKYGVLISEPSCSCCEVYFDSQLIREDWISAFLRYSLLETVPCVYEGVVDDDVIFEELPNLLDVPDYQVRSLLWKKIRICCTQLDMEDHRFEREVNVRFDTIRELMALCESDGDLLSSHGTLEDCLRLVEHVLFRPLPTPDHIKYNAAGVEIPFLDPNWDYIELVHDFFLQIITCPQIRVDTLRQSITNTFIRNYLYLFFSQDARERSVVRLGVHQLYGRLPRRRPLFRQVFGEMICNVILLHDRVTGIEEILTVYSSIVCGFARPMRKEHVRFLQHCLLPLHRLDRLVDFSSSLTRCLLLYIAQDGNLAPLIIRGILHYWPRSNTQNELLLIDEIEKIVQTMDGEQMASVICPLLTRLRKCLLSQQFLIAQRVLKLWDNGDFAQVVLYHDKNRLYSWNFMFSSLQQIANNNWNKQVRESARHVMDLYLKLAGH